MKVTTINGDTLRKEFTALEAAAIKHAAENCVAGDTFVGVPTSNEERYRNNGEVFRVVKYSGQNLVVVREKTGNEMRAIVINGSKTPVPTPTPTPADDDAEDTEEPEGEGAEDEKSEPTPKAEPEETPAPSFTQPTPAPQSSFGAFAAMLDGMTNEAAQKVMEQIKPIIAEAMAQKAPQKVEHVHTIKVGDMATKIEGLTHPKFERVLKYVANRRNVYLYGPAGSGKNVICEQIAKALNIPFYYQNTVMTKFDLTGYKNAAGEFESTEFYKAWTEGGLFMLDEVDNASAEALVTLNAALANGYYTFPGIGRVECSPNFYCVAAGNTNGQGATDEYCGRYKMDESSRDRFAFVEINYDEKIDKALSNGHDDIKEFIYELRRVCKEQRISLICGYRAIKNLAEFYEDEPKDIIEDFILKGMEKDSVREIAHRLEGDNRYTTAFKKLAE